MKNSSINLTLIAVLTVALSLGLAVALSMITPAVDLELPSSAGSSAVGVTIPDSSADSKPNTQPTVGGLPGGNKDAVKPGRLPGYEDAAINSDPDTFCYLLNSDITQEKPGSTANIMVENDPGNNCPMQLCYYLDDSDELIYVSPMLQPGEHINGDTLTVKQKKGEYKLNAVISVYDNETGELKTTFHERVTLTVNQKLFGLF